MQVALIHLALLVHHCPAFLLRVMQVLQQKRSQLMQVTSVMQDKLQAGA
jgi:hypothetical protein